ncbi:MAG TPA: MerR family transcriptional regulator [Candidatus Limnocylindrales bacterium]|nr:MerR family transcriptional regulator [Candidatus Limnocylindrales bacterium]
MQYDVSDLAAAAGISVDTLRFYQSGGLLQPPARSGRKAVYTPEHLDRLRLIRSMASKGLSLKAIRLLLDRESGPAASDTALLAALEEETDGPAYSGDELARQLGVPPALIRSVEEAGLAEGQETDDGKRRYTEGDLAAARGAIRLLSYGFPLTKLLALAVRHDRAIRKTCDSAIDLFDDYVRKKRGADASADGGENGEQVAAAFRELLPLVTAVVAHHFQRVLVNQALRRLKKKGDATTLSYALKVAARTKLKVSWQ